MIRLREHGRDAVQDYESAPCLHVHLLGLVEAEVHGCAYAFVDTLYDLVDELLVRDAHGRVHELASEATVALALAIPVLLLAPVAQLLEQL